MPPAHRNIGDEELPNDAGAGIRATTAGAASAAASRRNHGKREHDHRGAARILCATRHRPPEIPRGRDREEWTLLDEQKVAFNTICDLVDQDDGEKHLVLVTGGPGTGKSIIAMQLVGRLCRQEIPTVHVTNSSSFTTVTKSLVQVRRDRLWGSTAVEGLFRLSHNWVKRKDRFEVAICDEAHRFRRRTTLRPFVMSERPQ